MSDAGLAKRVTDLGVPMSAATIWKIKSSEPPRKVDLDEAQAIARAFDYESVEDFLEHQADARLRRAAYRFQMAARSLVIEATALAIGFEMYREALEGASVEAAQEAQAQVLRSLEQAEPDVAVVALLRRLADTPGRTLAGDEEDLEARIMAYVGDAPESLDRMLHASYITPRKGGLL